MRGGAVGQVRGSDRGTADDVTLRHGCLYQEAVDLKAWCLLTGRLRRYGTVRYSKRHICPSAGSQSRTAGQIV